MYPVQCALYRKVHTVQQSLFTVMYCGTVMLLYLAGNVAICKPNLLRWHLLLYHPLRCIHTVGGTVQYTGTVYTTENRQFTAHATMPCCHVVPTTTLQPLFIIIIAISWKISPENLHSSCCGTDYSTCLSMP